MRDHCLATPGLGWLGVVVWALALTGMRISELVSLRWADVDLAAGTVSLKDESGLSAAKRNGRAARTTKTGGGRTFPIHDDLRPVLEGLPRHPDGFVFRGPGGGRLTDRLVRRELKAKVIVPLSARFPTPDGEVGFRDGTPHSFRHFFCSLCANGRVPEQMLMRWLGHKSSAMVRHYYHAHDEEARRHMGRVSLGGPEAAWG
ncbi:MAG TPA: site-specific integrase [Planctomycetaceae bacterium]